MDYYIIQKMREVHVLRIPCIRNCTARHYIAPLHVELCILCESFVQAFLGLGRAQDLDSARVVAVRHVLQVQVEC